jgi:L-ribulose-5-phosphate 3-epimerase
MQTVAGKIGIMQGRLSPPIGGVIQAFPLSTWKAEFALAQRAGLHHIEWIFDREDFLNPIMSSAGIAEMLALSARTGVVIRSLCADYFIHETLLAGSPAEQARRAARLASLISQCDAADIRQLVLPFVDGSRIELPAQRESLIGLLRSLLPALARHRVEIHLETSLAPADFAALLREVDSPFIWVNYDTGNSASIGFDPREEFAAYGAQIASVHLKDRKRKGPTVPLGEGDVDFPLIAQLLNQVDYRGIFTLQVAREQPGGELRWVGHQLEWCREFLEKT